MSESKFVPFVKIEHHNIALLFSNYVESLGLSIEVTKAEDGYVLSCIEEQLEAVKTEFEAFIQQPNHEKYQQAAWQHGEVSNVSSQYPTLGSDFKSQFLAHAGIVTLVVFIACWLVYVLSVLGWASPLFHHLQFYRELSLESLIANPIKLIGPALFHFSLLHIAFNTMWWWQLGGSIEKILGKGELINLFLISAIISNLGQFLVTGPNFGGLSGVVYALVGYVWFMGWLAPQKGLYISKPVVGFLMVWMLLGFVDLLPVNMANTAHLLGMITGCILAVIKVKTAK